MSDKPVILFTVERYDISGGGVYEVISQVARRFAKNGYKVKVAATTSSGRFKPGVTGENGIEVHRFDVSGNAAHGLKGDIQSYTDFLLAQEYDILINYAAQQAITDISFINADKIRKTKILIPCGYSGLYWPDFAEYFKKLPEYLQHYDAQIFHSLNYRDHQYALRHGFKNLYLVPNGFDREAIDKNYSEFRKENGIAEDEKVILHVGNITGTKGHKEAIAVFFLSMIRKSVLVCIGKPLHPRSNYFKALVKMLSWMTFGTKRVLFPQYDHPHVIQAYKEADVFVFFSNIEYSPLVIFDAVATGLPFLASDCGNTVEIAEWTGMGQIVKTHKTEEGFSKIDYIDAIKKLRNILKEDKTPRTVNEAVERFSWDNLFKEYEKIVLSHWKDDVKEQFSSIDVIIPAYNAAGYIIETIESVLSQSYPVNRIIIVDDCSRDNTVEVIEKLNHPKITLLRHEKNKGVSTARNTGIQESRADYIALVDADDVWEADKLELQMRAFQKSDDKLGVVYTAYTHIDQDGKEIDAYTTKPRYRGNIVDKLLYTNYVSGSASSVLIRKRYINQVGLMKPYLSYGEDWDYWLRLASVCEYDFVDLPLVKVRIHANNAHNGRTYDKVRALRILRQEISVISDISKQVAIPYEVQYRFFMRFYNLFYKKTPMGRICFARKAMGHYFPQSKLRFIIISLTVIIKKILKKL